ncbi:MAG: hypothetical protein H7329_17245 [Opitutaceae bacterium]|nr:hypothetical protein [Cytophagales bacterium]
MRGAIATGERINFKKSFLNNISLSFSSKPCSKEWEYHALPQRTNLNEAEVLREMLPHLKAAGLDKSLLDFIAGYAKQLPSILIRDRT